jgi:hypothetical protein
MVSQRDLIAREPALAMLMGAMPMGQDFGFGEDMHALNDPAFAYAWGDDYGFGIASAYDPSLNIGLPGMGFGGIPLPPAAPPHWGWGAGPIAPAAAMAAASPVNPAHPAHAKEAAKRWELSNPHSTASRTALLDPNRDSSVKVERYSFSWSPAAPLVLGGGAPVAIPTFTQQPSTSIKGQRLLMNAPVPGFVQISTLQIANVNVLVGAAEDAFTYSAGAMGVMLDLPRLDPQNRATASGTYSGMLPLGYTAGFNFIFVITLQGPATLAGGYGQ